MVVSNKITELKRFNSSIGTALGAFTASATASSKTALEKLAASSVKRLFKP
jgi:hypothetical protein